ncbi:MAG: hypothetical protein M3412_08865 [Chloroflexota bacterium]|nr:hypothetical protein [Chloroflexota bacterium]
MSDTGRHCRPIRSATYAERSVTWRRTITNPLPTIASARAISIHEATVGDDGVPVPVSGRALTGLASMFSSGQPRACSSLLVSVL